MGEEGEDGNIKIVAIMSVVSRGNGTGGLRRRWQLAS